MKVKISEKSQKILKIILITLTVIISLIDLIELALIGKNLSYTNKLTPPSIKSLLDQAYMYYYSQITFLIIGFFYNISLTLNLYVSIYIAKKKFIPNIIINAVLMIGSIIICIMFINGSSDYQSYLSDQYKQIMNNLSICDYDLCNAANCARAKTYMSAHQMSIAYVVLVSILGVGLIPISYIINMNRIQQIEDLQK